MELDWLITSYDTGHNALLLRTWLFNFKMKALGKSTTLKTFLFVVFFKLLNIFSKDILGGI